MSSRRNDKLDIFFVMSDSLTAEDDHERKQALLVLCAFYMDRRDRIDGLYNRPRKRELKRLSRAVWAQLLASGLLEAKRIGVLSKVIKIVDGVAFDLLGDDLFLARRWHWDIARRIFAKRGGSIRHQLLRDSRAGLSEMDTHTLIVDYLKGEGFYQRDMP